MFNISRARKSQPIDLPIYADWELSTNILERYFWPKKQISYQNKIGLQSLVTRTFVILFFNFWTFPKNR